MQTGRLNRDAPSSRGRRLMFAATALAVTAVLAVDISPCRAATGGVVNLPPPRAKASPNGLTIAVDTTWVDGYGYRPIRVTVMSATPTPADQTITFRLKGWMSWRPDKPLMSVDQDIEIPAGSRRVTATVALPQHGQCHQVWWDVLVDGEFDEALSLAAGAGTVGTQITSWNSDRSVPRILVAGDAALAASHDTSAKGGLAFLGKLGGVATQGAAVGGQAGVIIGGSPFNVSNNTAAEAVVNAHVSCLPAELPTRWIDYTALDAILIEFAELAKLPSDHPAAFRAMVGWVTAGGNLWVHGANRNWDQLEEIEAILGTDPDRVDSDASLKRGWQDTRRLRAESGFESAYDLSLPPRALASIGRMKTQSRGRVVWMPLKLGKVFASQSALGGFKEIQAFAIAGNLLSTVKWSERHGLQPDAPNADFSNLLIPGVGLAPVTEFRILITLFVVLIGPVNYWFLRRAGRLHLLIITVPLAALLVTFALFGYAIVADGLGTSVRAQSIAHLDQRNGEIVSWTRLSYYSGLAPSGGLTFSEETAIYPIMPDWSEVSPYFQGVTAPNRALQWEDRQYLTTGWLNSRTPTQYLAVAARKSEKRLDVTLSEDAVNVSNRLGADLELLIVRDEDGKLSWGESIAARAEAELTPVDEPTVAARLRRLVGDNAPSFPLGYADSSGRMFRQRSGRRGWSGGNAGEAQMTESYLDKSIAGVVPIGDRSNRLIAVDNRGYIAIMRSGAVVEMGIESYSEDASFHVVVGKF